MRPRNLHVEDATPKGNALDQHTRAPARGDGGGTSSRRVGFVGFRTRDADLVAQSIGRFMNMIQFYCLIILYSAIHASSKSEDIQSGGSGCGLRSRNGGGDQRGLGRSEYWTGRPTT